MKSFRMIECSIAFATGITVFVMSIDLKCDIVTKTILTTGGLSVAIFAAIVAGNELKKK